MTESQDAFIDVGLSLFVLRDLSLKMSKNG